MGGPAPLEGWDNFYVIVGAAAGVLIGLQFVVIALQRDVTEGAGAAVRAFGSPTIVHLTAVLALSAIIMMPRHTRSSLGTVVLVAAAGLLAYVGWVFGKAREQDIYQPDLEDWIWHYCLPALAYLSLLGAGAWVWSAPSKALYAVAASVLLLLVVGIHNAWDAAVYVVITRSGSG